MRGFEFAVGNWRRELNERATDASKASNAGVAMAIASSIDLVLKSGLAVGDVSKLGGWGLRGGSTGSPPTSG